MEYLGGVFSVFIFTNLCVKTYLLTHYYCFYIYILLKSFKFVIIVEYVSFIFLTIFYIAGGVV